MKLSLKLHFERAKNPRHLIVIEELVREKNLDLVKESPTGWGRASPKRDDNRHNMLSVQGVQQPHLSEATVNKYTKINFTKHALTLDSRNTAMIAV